jgi:hypothetical protein
VLHNGFRNVVVVDGAKYTFELATCSFAFYGTNDTSKNGLCIDGVLPSDGTVGEGSGFNVADEIF